MQNDLRTECELASPEGKWVKEGKRCAANIATV